MAEKNMRLRVVLDLVDKALAPLKRISQGSKDTAATLKAARDQLKQLNATQAAVGKFRETQAGLQQTEAKLKAARVGLEQLKGGLNQTGVPTKAFAASLAKAHAEADRLGATFNTQKQQLRQLDTRLTAAGISTRNLAGGEQQLSARIASTTASINTQTAALKRQSDEQRRLAKLQSQAMKGAAIGAGMTAAGAASIYAGRQMTRPVLATTSAFSQQENASSQLRASMMLADGSVPDEFAQIDALAKRLGDRLPGTTADFTDLMTVLRKEGISAAAILGGTGEAAALLGVQLKMPVAQAAAFAAKMQDATQASESEMQGLMDMLQKNAYLGADENYQLNGITKMSGAMGLLRLKGQDAYKALSPLLVMMNQAGMTDGASAGNAIDKIFEAGLDRKKLGKANAMLSKRGIKLNFADKNGKFAGMENFFAQIEKIKALGDNDMLKRDVMSQLFGTDSQNRQVLSNLMAKGYAGYKETVAKMDAQASLQQRVNEQLGTLSNVVEAAQGSATNALASVGAAMAPDLKDLVNWLGEAGGKANAWIQENQSLVRILGLGALGLAAFIAAAGALLIPLGLLVAKGMLLRWVLAKIGVSAGAASVFKTLFSWGSKALPVIARFAPMLLRLLGPIGLVITAGWMIYNNWQAMWDGCVAIWEDFSTWFMGLMSGFGSWIGSMWNSATTMASTALNAFVSGVLNLIDGGVGAWVLALLNFSPFGLLWNAFTTALAALGIQVPEQFRSFGGFIMDGLIGGITGRLAALKDAVVGAASSAATWFKEKLGIASPSKLFTQFGGWISEGAANGITAGQAGVRAAALAMAGAAAAPVGAVGIDGGTAPIGAGPSIAPRISAPAPDAGGNYTFQIYAAPGMDAQAIARAVRAEIENIDRQKASRGRSSMHDLS